MFNNYFYRIAQINERKELDPRSFLTQWYINNPNFLEMKKNLEDIYIIMTYNHLDISFVKYLYNDFNAGFYAYVKNNLERINDEETKQKFKNISEFEKQELVISSPNLFILRGNLTAGDLYNIFQNLVRLINLLKFKVNGDLEKTLYLINIFNDPDYNISQKVYSKSHASAQYKSARESDSSSKWFLDKISKFISEDIKARKGMIKHLTDIDDFTEYINYNNYEDFFLDLYYNGFFEESANINYRFLRHELSKKFIKNENFWEEKKSDSKSRSVPSKYFNEFSLDNSSNKEKQIFADFEKLGLHAIPAEQKSSMSMLDENGEKFGFRIDFLLPCNVREYDGENYSLRQDIIFIGEYFGYFGADYDAKKVKKMQW